MTLISASEMQQHIEGAAGVHISNNCEWSEKGVSHLEQEILVLRHFSDIEFRAVLAHEMIHSWQTRNNLQEIYNSESDELKHMKCEGFAQMGSWLVYSRAQNHITKQKKMSLQIFAAEDFSDVRKQRPILWRSFQADF